MGQISGHLVSAFFLFSCLYLISSSNNNNLQKNVVSHHRIICFLTIFLHFSCLYLYLLMLPQVDEGFIVALLANSVNLNMLSLLLGSIPFLVNQHILSTVQTKLPTSKRLVFILDFWFFFLSFLLFHKYIIFADTAVVPNCLVRVRGNIQWSSTVSFLPTTINY